MAAPVNQSAERVRPRRWLGYLSSPWIRYAAIAIFLLACIFAIRRGRNYDPNGSQTCDFIAPYSGAQCLVHGCDPYYSPDLQTQYVAAHGNPAALDERHSWSVLLPVYPASTFLLIVPLTVLDYPHAQVVWFYAGALLFCAALGILATFVAIDLQWVYFLLVAGLLNSANTDFLLGPGQPSTFAIAFTAIAVWAFYKMRWSWLGIVSLALAMAMKPHMAIAVFVFLMLKKGLRKQALAAGCIALVLLFASVLRLRAATGSFAWFGHFQHAVGSGIQPGGTNAPTPENPSAPHIINIQTIVSLWQPSPPRYGKISMLIVGAIGVMWLAGFFRAKGTDELLAMAGLLALSLLPVYHRDYDGRLLILTIPPLVALLRNHLSLGILLFVVSAPLVFIQTTMHTLHYLDMVQKRELSGWQTLFYLRQQSLSLLAIAVLWSAILYFLPRALESGADQVS